MGLAFELGGGEEWPIADAHEREDRPRVLDGERDGVEDPRARRLVAGVPLVRAQVSAEVVELGSRQGAGGLAIALAGAHEAQRGREWNHERGREHERRAGDGERPPVGATAAGGLSAPSCPPASSAP